MGEKREGTSVLYTILSIKIVERLNYGFQNKVNELIGIISEV